MPVASRHFSFQRRRTRAGSTVRSWVVALLLLIGALVVPALCRAGGAPVGVDSRSLTPAESRARAAGAPAQSGVFVTEGVRLPYLCQGQGEVVLILPDSSDALDSWRPQVAALGERFKAVAYLRRSQVAPGAPFASTPPRFDETSAASSVRRHPLLAPAATTADEGALRDLLVFLSSLTSSPVSVVGEGAGARLALRLALAYPERVKCLVLSAPDPRWFPRDAAVEAARTGATLPPVADTMLACRRLWRVGVPVMVLTGERDPRDFGEGSTLRCIRSVRQQWLAGAGVRPHAHASEEFNRAVTRFLERQRLTAGEP
jgi:pimeloyl-ACP methyl ester carboxylesterase